MKKLKLSKVKEEMSLEDLQRELNDAVQQKFGAAGATDSWRYYVVETFPGYVIARGNDDKLYQIPYAINVAGEVELGDAQEVETVYAPVSQAAKISSAGDLVDDGFTWPVVVAKSGKATGRLELPEGQQMAHEFSPQLIADFATAVNGARFGRRHVVAGEEPSDPARIAGWFSNGSVVGDETHASLHLLKNETALRDKLVAAKEAGKLDLFGLSVDAYVGFRPVKENGAVKLVGERLGKLVSVDLVTETGAGGKFLQYAAGKETLAEISRLQQGAIKTGSTATSGEKHGSPEGAGRQQGEAMKEKILKVIEALRKLDAGAAEQHKQKLDAAKDEQLPEVLVAVTEAATSAAEKAANAAVTAIDAKQIQTDAKEVLVKVNEALAEAKKVQAENLITAKLAEAKLPKPAESSVRRHLAARATAVTTEEIDAEIKATRDEYAAMTNVGTVSRGRGVTVGLDSTDKVQLAFDRLLGVKEAMASGVSGFRSIKEAYVFVTGDEDLAFGTNGRGGFLSIREAASLTSDFPNLLANSMTKRLLADYREVGLGGLEQIVTMTDVSDFKTQDRVRFGYLGDLATVAEDGAYTEFGKPTDEKVQYAATKRGNIFTISRESILNDDLSKFTVIPQRIARAARRTMKQFITTFLTGNPNFDPDGVAMFHATHNNLGAAALSIDELIQREIKLGLQQEKDSTKPLGFPLDFLIVPINLKATAYKINNAQEYNPGPDIKEPNPFYQRFGAAGERIIVNELLDGSDTNDWYCGSLPQNSGPIIELGFVQGQREPVILVQNDPSQGGTFTNDRITYKVRHEYGGDFVDFRPIQKNVV